MTYKQARANAHSAYEKGLVQAHTRDAVLKAIDKDEERSQKEHKHRLKHSKQ